jgi:S1-C subfamily serine protease
MNIVDLLVILVALLAIFRGLRRGLVGQVFELGGGFLGLVVGLALGPRIASYFIERPGVSGALISLFVVFVALSLGQTAGYIVGHRFGGIARKARLGGLDSGLGAAFSVLVWFVSFWLIGTLLLQGPSREVARALRKSQALQLASEVFPEPPNILAYLGQYLSTSGFPQVFAGLPRSISPPVDLPSQAEARAAARAAQASTVRVVVSACGGLQLGTGWVSDQGTIVTNAHVVAGGTEVTVQELGNGDQTGQVVLFDPETDIAIIRAEGIGARPLPLETQVQERATPGATLGYPGEANGEFVVKRAAVQNSYDATGRDIYGRNLVTREVYELRSPVRQGDSGGPFVLPDGRVAGVVFAASTTDGGTGYALTGQEVMDEVRQGSQRTEPVSTGNCTR